MFKIEVKCENFLGNEYTETLRFNLSEHELMDLASENPVFNADFLAYIAEQQDMIAMMQIIRKLIDISYGVLSEDGKKFKKTPELLEDFKSSPAYDAFVDQLVGGDSDSVMRSFIIGIFPKKYAEEIAKRVKDSTTNLSVVG